MTSPIRRLLVATFTSPEPSDVVFCEDTLAPPAGSQVLELGFSEISLAQAITASCRFMAASCRKTSLKTFRSQFPRWHWRRMSSGEAQWWFLGRWSCWEVRRPGIFWRPGWKFGSQHSHKIAPHHFSDHHCHSMHHRYQRPQTGPFSCFENTPL